VAIGAFGAWALARLVGIDAHDDTGYIAAPMAFTPYVAAAAVLLPFAALVTRQIVAAVVSGVVVLAFGYAVVPRIAAGGEAGHGELRVLTLNVRLGHADPADVVALIRREHPDVVSLQELTTGLAGRLRSGGIGELLPHQALNAAPGASGTGLYSRYPLTEVRRFDERTSFEMTAANLRVPGKPPVAVIAVHTSPPIPGSPTRHWHRDFSLLPAPSGVSILAGDFNATLDHAPLRALIGTGYDDAAYESGDALVPSWPTDRPLPPVTIDHVLIHGLTSVDVRGETVPSTDHRALIADLRF
jgi:endonuclease/exonuclease/phosphatase (EEP) superfamily protein YafD